MKKPRLVLIDAAIADILDQADWLPSTIGAPYALTTALPTPTKNPSSRS
jgi:hypothetical protein